MAARAMCLLMIIANCPKKNPVCVGVRAAYVNYGFNLRCNGC